MTKQTNPKENRIFKVNDRVCKRPVRNAISAANTPKQMPVRHGVIIERKQFKQRTRTAANGFCYRWQSKIQWDGTQTSDWVDDIRIIHESELETYLAHS